MTDAIISIPGAEPLAVLDARGWVRGSYGTKASGPVCLHGAIRLCAPVLGDAQIIEVVAARQGWGTSWNDHPSTNEGMVRALLAAGIEITDADLEVAFGPQWEAVVWIVRRAAVLMGDERDALAAATAAALAPAWGAARYAATTAARDAARDAALFAARSAAAWFAAGRDAGREAVLAAALCAVLWDLAFDAGPFTLKQRDLSIGPWETVIGLPPTLTRSTRQ